MSLLAIRGTDSEKPPGLYFTQAPHKQQTRIARKPVPVPGGLCHVHSSSQSRLHRVVCRSRLGVPVV